MGESNHGSPPSARPFDATVQRLLSQGKTTGLPEEGLAAFGIKSVSECGGDKDSILRCVKIVHSDNSAALVFRCEPNNESNPSWVEKMWFDAVRHKVEWVVKLNVEGQMLHWYHDDEAMLNNRGYDVRLFVIQCAEEPPVASIMKLARYISEKINEIPTNFTTITVVPDKFFWIPCSDNPVWSDVIGSDAALKTLVEKTGVPKAGYYEANHGTIHSYFRPHTFTLDLARVLRAPIEQVAPGLRGGMAAALEESPPGDEMIKIEPQHTDESDDDL